MSENATPRTDAAEWIGIFTSRTRNISLAQQQAALRTLPLTQGTVGATAHVVYSQFSRNLERELTAANARIAELEKDAARYRHMRGSAEFQNRNGPGLYWYLPRWNGELPIGERLDAVIDAAMSAKP